MDSEEALAAIREQEHRWRRNDIGNREFRSSVRRILASVPENTEADDDSRLG